MVWTLGYGNYNFSLIYFLFSLSGDIITNSTIDGIRLSKEVVTLSGNQTIKGLKTFAKNITAHGNIIVNGTVDDVDVSELDRTAIKINGIQNVTAPIIFSGNVTIERNLNILGNVNGINLTELRDDIVTKSGNQTITAPVTFETVEISNLTVNGTVNGIRIPDDLIPLDYDVDIYGNLIFGGKIVFENSLNLSNTSKINGQVLKEFSNKVVLNGSDQVITGKKIFLNNIHMKSNLSVDGKIDGKKVPDDLVTLNTVQNITGKKTFTKPLTILGGLHTKLINVTTTVNGVDISELTKVAVYKSSNQTINGTVTITENTLSNGDLSVGHLVNGVNLTELFSKAVRLSVPQIIRGNKTFNNSVEFHGPLTSPGKVNGVNISHLDKIAMRKFGDQIIYGEKRFTETVEVDGNIWNGTINGKDLSKFRNSIVTRTGNENITGQIVFKNVAFMNLKVAGLIDGVNFSNVVRTTGDQIVSGEKNFAGGLTAKKSVIVNGNVNGVDLSDLDATAMKVVGDQNISADIIFREGISVNGSINTTALVNGIDVSELAKDAVYVDRKEEITGHKVFHQNVKIKGNVHFGKSINKIDFNHLAVDTLLKSKDQVLCGNKTFVSPHGITVSSNVKARRVHVSGFIDNVNITDLNENAVRLTSNQTLTGHFTFENLTKFDGNVVVKGLVNGVNISDVMTKSGRQLVTGYKQFQELVVDGDVAISGTADGVDLSEFSKSRVTLSTNQVVEGIKRFTSNITVLGNIDFTDNATVNGVDLSEELVLTDKPSTVSGKKVFTRNVMVLNNMNVSGLVNGVDLRALDRDALKVSGDRNLTGFNVFRENFTVLGMYELNLFVM